MTDKLVKIREALNKKYFEREEEIEGMLIALLSRQHVLLIGEPGTGKSLLSM
ncbi:ATPase, partial [Listeria monocytogenes]|nr:ATPase [Listeria monocytogenes]EKS1920449.1 ATPase [Listeria monocytogenes]